RTAPLPLRAQGGRAASAGLLFALRRSPGLLPARRARQAWRSPGGLATCGGSPVCSRHSDSTWLVEGPCSTQPRTVAQRACLPVGCVEPGEKSGGTLHHVRRGRPVVLGAAGVGEQVPVTGVELDLQLGVFGLHRSGGLEVALLGEEGVVVHSVYLNRASAGP